MSLEFSIQKCEMHVCNREITFDIHICISYDDAYYCRGLVWKELHNNIIAAVGLFTRMKRECARFAREVTNCNFSTKKLGRGVVLR